MSGAVPSAGRALESARSALRVAFGDRVRTAGVDRVEALALNDTVVPGHASVRLVGDTLDVHPVPPPTSPTFEGFLDGIQRSSTVAYIDGVPLLHGTAAVAIRQRSAAGRLSTWRPPMIEHAVYASHALLGDGTWAELHAVMSLRGHLLRDSDNNLPVPSRHPSALLRQSMDALARVRNAMERTLGEQWCDAHDTRPLYVDGSLRGSHALMQSTGAVGVVKSHATLYLPDDAFSVLASLQAAQRTSVLEALDAAGRTRSLTWYLRLRTAAGHDPFFGLIRVETGIRDGGASVLEQHADAISSWLLAERVPLSKPDARWDVLPYAIRDCAVYLRAVA